MRFFLRAVCHLAITSCFMVAGSVADAGLVFGPETINFGTSSVVGGGGYPGTDGTAVRFQTGTIDAPG